MSPPSDTKEFEHKILIAIDGSRPSLRAASYAAGMTSMIPALHFVLLYVLPAIPPYLEDGWKTDKRARAKLKTLRNTNLATGENILEKAKEHLVSHHVPEEYIELKILPRTAGLARDILFEAEQGLYDALIVGRRGLSRPQELFMGSVSNRLIQHAHKIPLWVVDQEITQPKVLVALDGSEPSLRAVDQVAFMLGDHSKAAVHFLHVAPRLQSVCPIDFGDEDTLIDLDHDYDEMEEEFMREDEACLDDFTPRAVNILSRAGFSSDRITVETREVTLGVARTIIKAAKEGGFGTVVLGRSGLNRAHFLGSVSDRVVRRAEGLAIWLVN